MSRRSIIWFAVGLAATFLTVEIAARQLGPSASARVVLEQHGNGLEAVGSSVPLLFVGDSSSGAAFDPTLYRDLTGTESYNVWLPDASATMVDRLVNDFALADTATKTVVIGLTARMFNHTVRPARLELVGELSNSLPWQARTSPSVFTTMEQWAGERVGLIRYRAGLRRPSDWVISYQSKARLELEDRGRVTFFLDKSVDDIRETYPAGERAALADYSVSDEEVEALTDLVERLHADGVSVHVLLLPTNDHIYDEFFPRGNLDQVAFRDRIGAAMADRPVTLTDMTELGRSAEFFADGNHLNRAGSTRFTELLSERLGA